MHSRPKPGDPGYREWRDQQNAYQNARRRGEYQAGKPCRHPDCQVVVSKRVQVCPRHKEAYPCEDCGETKPHHSQGLCHRCYRALPANRARVKGWNLKNRYGITAEEYDGMLKAQDGRCRGCPRTPEEAGTLHVDHCHKTGRNRGLLCGDCNRVLGLVRDEPETLERLAAYLRG